MDDTAPEADTYKDMRSGHHVLDREAKQSAKYYGYRSVHPSWVGQTYFPRDLVNDLDYHPNLYRISSTSAHSPRHFQPRGSVPTSTWTKRDMWLDRAVDIYPLDRRHHQGRKVREKRYDSYHDHSVGRKTRQKARMLAFAVEDAHLILAGENFYQVAGIDTCDFDDNDVDDEVEPTDGVENETTAPCQSVILVEGALQDVSPSAFDDQADWDVASWSNVDGLDGGSESEGFDFVADHDFDVVSLSSLANDSELG